MTISYLPEGRVFIFVYVSEDGYCITFSSIQDFVTTQNVIDPHFYVFNNVAIEPNSIITSNLIIIYYRLFMMVWILIVRAVVFYYYLDYSI